jgi:3-oxoacyl-[acyl-carrier-protein] synthase III
MRFAEVAQQVLRDEIGLPLSAWRLDLADVGNVGGATFAIVLDRLLASRRVKPGELVVSFAEESSKWMFAGAALRWNP